MMHGYDARRVHVCIHNVMRSVGMTPLYRAIMSGSAETCRILVHAGSDVNMRRLGITGAASSAETPLIKYVM